MNYDPKARLLSRKELSSRLGLSVRQTYRIDDLPKPIALHAGANAKRLWTESQLIEWLESKRNEGAAR